MMKVVALISGGKDSCFNMMHCIAMGHEIVALANLYPSVEGETDSYMYQTVGSEAIGVYSEAMGLPLFRREIKGSSKEVGLNYETNKDDEVEDLYCLLKNMQTEIAFDAVSCGAILSDYQRIRVENVCTRLNLVSLAYLWRQDQKELLQSMIENHLTAIIIKTAALGLVPNRHLGKTLKEMQAHLITLNHKYGSHICGEGGEYETFTVDCPLFKKRIVVDKSEIVLHSDDGVASVAYLHLKSLRLEDKKQEKFDFSRLFKLPLSTAETPLLTDKNRFKVLQQCDTKWNSKITMDAKCVRTSCGSSFACGPFASVNNLCGFCSSRLHDEDIVQSTRDTFSKLIKLLENHNHTLSDVISVYFCLADIKHFSLINSIYKTYFGHNPPSRVCISPSLSSDVDNNDTDVVLFQLDCLSYKNNADYPKKVMHVQGISHWAPANIGPYSQCSMVGDLCFVAGQIGLVPGTMNIIEGGIENEAVLSLQHVVSVISAMESSLNLGDVIQCVCYVTDNSYIKVVQTVWEKAVLDYEDMLSNVVYVVIDILPRNALVEWQVVVSKSSRIAFSQTTFCDNPDALDFNKSLQTLIQRYNMETESKLDRSVVEILQARLFFEKRNLVLTEVHNIMQKSQQNSLFPIALVPVKAVFKHANYASVPMALIGLAVQTNFEENS